MSAIIAQKAAPRSGFGRYSAGSFGAVISEASG
jgi:hypothetical protein